MIKVDNQKVISKIAKSLFKGNKLRNFFAVVAIILTTVMFTTLFTVVASMITSIQESTMRQVGGSAHGSFKYLSQEEYDKLKTHKSIKDIQYSIVLGFAENNELKKHPSEIRYATDKESEYMFANPTTGRMPNRYNEIAMDTLVLDSLCIPHKLGQKITLEYSLNKEKISDTFILTGYWEGDKVIPASQIWISREYLDAKLKNFVPLSDDKLVGTITADVMFNNPINVEGKLKKIITESGYNLNDIDYGVNWAYVLSGDEVSIGGILSIISGILLIMLCGYLIIYNIFYISVSKDIRFYGLLKTIGTTSKQIKKIIRKQAIVLCFIGIPLGLILGYFTGVVMTPMFLVHINIVVTKISANPIIFIAAIILAAATVFISTKKPAKIAGKVTPIEALRSTDGEVNYKVKSKKSYGGNLSLIAISNVLRNRKRAIIVTISLSLSLIILNCTHSIVNGFDMNTFLSKMISTDFEVADAGYFNVYLGYNGQETITDNFIKELSSQKGVEEIGNIRFTENNYPVKGILKTNIDKLKIDFPDVFEGKFAKEINKELERGVIPAHIYGMDKIGLEQLEIFDGKFDYKKFKSGKYIIVSAFDNKGYGRYYNVGDKVSLDYGDGNKKEYEVMAVGNIPFDLSIRHSHFVNPEFVIQNEEFISEVKDNTAPMLTIMNTDDTYKEDIEKYLKNYCENINHDMEYKSKKTYEEEFNSMENTYMITGTVLSFIIAFIGIMNFINTMITSVIVRKHELAMLESIGMTKKQMKKMLMLEGLTYAFFTTIFVLTVGTIIAYVGVNAIVGSIWFFKFKFSITPVLMCLPILFLLSLIVPVLCYRFASKDSIVERLRRIE